MHESPAEVVLFVANPQQIVTRYHIIIIIMIHFDDIMSQYNIACFLKLLFLSVIYYEACNYIKYGYCHDSTIEILDRRGIVMAQTYNIYLISYSILMGGYMRIK